jgi:hypothetical protein
MKPKTVISLLVVVLILAGTSYFLLKDQSSNKNQNQMGTELMKDLPLNDISAITIFGPKGSVELMRGPSVWHVKNKYEYPADFGQIVDLTKKIKRIKIGRTFVAKDDTLARQKLYDPKNQNASDDRKGVRITLFNQKKKTIADLILGNTRQTSSDGSGQYLRHADKNTVYLVNDNFSLVEQKPEEWLEKEVINIDSKEIKAITCYVNDSGQRLYQLERKEEGAAPKLSFPPKKGVVDTHKVDQIFESLSPLNIEDISGPPRKAEEPLPRTFARLEYQLYNGKIITVYPSSHSEKDPESAQYQVVLTMDYTQPETPETAETSKTTPKKDVDDKTDDQNTKTDSREKNKTKEIESPEDIKKEAVALNEKLKIWTFELAKWQYDGFIISKEGLMESKKENSIPSN